MTFVLTGLWRPFDWQRYYLRLIALLPVVYVAGIALLSGCISLEKRAEGGPVTPMADRAGDLS